MHSAPLPPSRPATTASSRVSVRASAFSAVGPQAKLKCLSLKVTSVSSRGVAWLGRFTHQTLSPLASTSLSWKSFTPPRPLIRTRKANARGHWTGMERLMTA